MFLNEHHMDNQLQQLRDQLNRRYNPEEFADLCNRLHINPDHLPQFIPYQQIDYLLLYIYYSRRQYDFINVLDETRPGFDWPLDSHELTDIFQQLLLERPLPPLANNLPSTSHFFGRQPHIQRILQDLQPGRVTTITGPAGIGKTTLAIQILAQLTHNFQHPLPLFPDGLIFHSFYDNPHLEIAYSNVIRSFDPTAIDFSANVVSGLLSRKQAFLFLDGAERVKKLDHLLSLIGRCGVILTTRQRNQVHDSQYHDSLSTLSQKDSRKLFYALASKKIDDETVAHDICQLLDGFPLALNLMGSFLAYGTMTAKSLLQRLRDAPFHTLHHYSPTRREKTVTWILQQSVKQVGHEAQEILALIGCLAYAPLPMFTLQAIYQDVIPSLRKLDNFGLIRQKQETIQATHALIHNYAQRRMAASKKDVEQLADFYIQYVEQPEQKTLEGYKRIDEHRFHLLALLEHLKKHENWPLVVALTWTINYYLEIQGHSFERIDALQLGLVAARATNNHHAEGVFQGNLGIAYSNLGQDRKAIEEYEVALTIFREFGDRFNEGNHIGNLGNTYLKLGKVEKAIELYNAAIIIMQEIEDRRSEGVHVGNLGNALRETGQFKKAIEQYEMALIIAKEVGDRRREATHVGNLGNVFSEMGQIKKAIEQYETALIIAQEVGDRRNEGTWLGNLGNLHRDLGQVEIAIEYYNAAIDIAQEIRDKRGEGVYTGNLGGVYFVIGQSGKAIEQLETALIIAKEVGDRRFEGTWLGNLGNLHRDLGQVEIAIEYYNAAIDIAREVGDKQGEGSILGSLGSAYHTLGHLEEAVEIYKLAIAIARKIGHRNEGMWLGNLSNVYRNLGQIEQAIRGFEKALILVRTIEDKSVEAFCLCNLGKAYHDVGQPEKAIQLYEAALTIAREIGDRRGEENYLGTLARGYHTVGQIEEAIELYNAAIAIAREIGDKLNEATCLGNLGNLYLDSGHMKRAITQYETALIISQEIGDKLNEGVWLGNLGLIYSDLGQIDKAINHFEAALIISQEIGHRLNEGISLFNLGNIFGDKGQVEYEIDYLMQALVILEEVQSPMATKARQHLHKALRKGEN